MRRPLLVALACLALAAAGCGSTDTSTPVACLEPAPTYLRALEAAPGDVRLDRTTPISDCLTPNQGGGDLARVGTAMLRATTELNTEAREQPGGATNLQLGYLLGAVERGAEATEGIHDELVRRLTAAARYSPDNRPLPGSFYQAYRSGYSAGRKNG